MSAPGIRALNIARVLAARVPGSRVTLAIPNAGGGPEGEPFEVVHHAAPRLPGLIRGNDVIVAQYVRSSSLPFLAGKRVVLDFFANFVAEWLELWAEKPDDPTRDADLDGNRRYLNLQLSQADLVLAANERQRDLWIGNLAAIGRITPEVYEADPSLRSLIDIAPFGVRPDPPVARRHVLKGVHPGIGPDDFVLIWNGGVLHWYDPSTLLQAMSIVNRTMPQVKLFFLGTKYPIDDPIEGRTVEDMLALSRSLGLTDRCVFFNEGWVDYTDSGDYLLEADAGVCTYFDDLETHFAHRVRLVDLLWAEKPIICNRDDWVAEELVRGRRMGISVPFRDVNALAGAIIKLAEDSVFRKECADNIRALKPELSWDVCLQPLIRFCTDLPRSSRSRSYGHTALLGASYAMARLEQEVRRLSSRLPLRRLGLA